MNWPLLLILTISQIYAQSTLKGQSKNTPWGGHWWTMHTGELALGWNLDNGQFSSDFTPGQAAQFNQCLTDETPICKNLMKSYLAKQGRELSPTMKFDLWVKKQLEEAYGGPAPVTAYARATQNELKIHYIDSENHRHAGTAGFAGKCTGWSLSNMDYTEPTKTKEIYGIIFNPADIKGILAAIYNGAQFFVPDHLAMGLAFRTEGEGNTKEAYEDPAPHILIEAFEKHIKEEKKIIVADMDATEGVWNHPVYKYEVKFSKVNGQKVEGKIAIHYADDQKGIDEVFSTQAKRIDLVKKDLEFEMTVPKDWKGDLKKVTSSKWAPGYSADNHPDSLIFGIEKDWRKSIYEYKTTDMKLEVNYQLIKKVNLGDGYKVIVDELLKQYYQ